MKDASNVSLAEQVCNDAWHINNWIFEELSKTNNEINKNKFRESIYLECPELKILHGYIQYNKT